jgi:hypothetical protein
MTKPANPQKGKTFQTGRERKGRRDKTPEPARDRESSTAPLSQ